MDPAAGVASAVVGQAAYSYNRENFLYDRKLRLKKEFQEMKLRIVQADLWRQDIRDIIGLVETKTKLYLLVNMFLLGLTIQLWVQGRLPVGTPDWLMLGSQIANVGAFTFMLLTVWLAMHASVSAQGYQARLLTQLVRLPIPTWEELESCRTYASSFEKLEARQMFRIPFLMGQQESMVSPDTGTPLADTTGIATGGAETHDRGEAIDPWGLESRADTCELGCPHNEECAQLRHIKLVRQAQKFWQGYDAFARISMTLGVNQLMLSMSYYILGYVYLQALAPWAAYTGVISMTALAYIIAKLDITLGQGKQLAINTLLVSGPTFSCVATFHVGNGEFTRYQAPAAFLSHGILALCLAWFSQLKVTHGGALLPTAFKHILYLDVFGWIGRKYPDSEQIDLQAEVTGRQLSAESPEAPSSIVEQSMCESDTESRRNSAEEEPQISHYALEYMDLKRSEEDSDEEALADDGQNMLQRTSRRRKDPALHSVAYDARTGRSVPTRPQEFMPASTVQDLRTVPGAPRMWEGISNEGDPKNFFESSSFYPHITGLAEQKNYHKWEKMYPAVGGHEHERPGQLPFMTFSFGSTLLGFAWLIAAAYQLQVNNAAMRTYFEASEKRLQDAVVNTMQNATGTNLLQHWRAVPEPLVVSWPSSHIRPHALSCDSSGQHFVVTDGLSMFFAEVGTRRPLLGRSIGAARNQSLNFVEVGRCQSLLGESIDDTAVACTEAAVEASSCNALVLHRRGSRVADCPIVRESSTVRGGSTAKLSQAWLQNDVVPEKIGSLLFDPACTGASRLDCVSAGTTLGRVAHLQHSASVEVAAMGELFPDDIVERPGKDDVSSRPHLQRKFNSQYIGVLQHEHGRVKVLDTSSDLAEVGSMMIPLQVPLEAVCMGGGYMYVMSEGAEPQMWRLPLPKDLHL